MPKSFLDAAEIVCDSLRDLHLVPPFRAERRMNHDQVSQASILMILGEHVFGHQNVSSSAAISSYVCLP